VNKILTIIIAGVMLTGCGTMTGKDVIKSINLAKNASMITKAGVSEEITNCVKDVFDPGNRGSGC
jgi:uncharacterized protein YcfL